MHQLNGTMNAQLSTAAEPSGPVYHVDWFARREYSVGLQYAYRREMSYIIR